MAVTCRAGLFDEDGDDWARIKAALNRIAIGDNPGCWEKPDRIVVTDRLTGGFTEALVLRIEVVRDGHRRRQIAKVGVNVAAEWEAFQQIIRKSPSVLCPPIEAVSIGVLDPSQLLGEDEAVIYTDVVQFAGAQAVDLEDVARNAAGGDPAEVSKACTVITTLVTLATIVLYSDHKVLGQESWQALNPLLGPDLRLRDARIDHSQPASGHRALTDAESPLPERLFLMALVVEGLPGPARAPFAPGTPVVLRGFRRAPDFGPRVAERDNVTVEVGAGVLAEIAGAGTFTVRGIIEAWRSPLTWRRIRQALPELTVTDSGVRLGEVSIAHPFAALRQALTDETKGVVISSVHGDVNPRNVLVADNRPFLIDYASPRKDRPVQSDLAWLELNLLRQPFAETLTGAGLVKLQRLLALGDRVAALPESPERGQVDEALVAALDDLSLAGPLQVLSTIRNRARLIYPDDNHEVREWWREYHLQLLLAAHHMFKWPDERQSAGSWRATVAAAAVASEQIQDAEGPFGPASLGPFGPASLGPWRFWPANDREAPAAAIAPLLPATRAGLSVLSELISGINLVTSGAAPVLCEHLRRISAGALLADAAGRAGAARDPYVELSAIDLGPVPRSSAEDDDEVELARVTDRPDPGDLAATKRVLIGKRVVVVGNSGSGKTSLLHALERRWLRLPAESDSWPGDTPVPRLPVLMTAPELSRSLKDDSDAVWEWISGSFTIGAGTMRSLFTNGAIHLLVDDLDRVKGDDRRNVAGWLNYIRKDFPRVLVTVCYRGTTDLADLADLPGWRVVALREPDSAWIGRYLARHPSAVAGAIADRVLGGSTDPALARLAHNPLMLAMLAGLPGAEQVPTAGDLLERYVAVRQPELWLGWAELFAERQVSLGLDELKDEEFLAGTSSEIVSGWPQARDRLTSLGIMVREGSASRFTIWVYQHDFAARVLRARIGADPLAASRLALSFGWRPAFAMFVSFTTTTPEVLGDLVRAVAGGDPGYAVLLLRSAASCPDVLVRWFVAGQERLLRADLAGQFARERAARALAELGTEVELESSDGRSGTPVYGRVLAAIADDDAEPDWREYCLAVLGDAYRTARPGPLQTRLAGRLVSQAARLIANGAAPARVRAAAARLIGDLRFHGIVALLADQLDGDVPWPVRHEARLALGSLGERLPARLTAAYRRAQVGRLADLERDLLSATSAAQGRRLQEERYDLLRRLAGPDRLPELLNCRFAFEIGGDPIRELIDSTVAGETSRPPADDEPGWRIMLLDPEIPSYERMLAVIESQDPLAAAAAAHRLLGERAGLAPEAFAALAAGERADLVPIAAALAAQRSVDLAEVVRYCRVLLGRYGEPDPPPLDYLGALIGAIWVRDRAIGVREAWRAQRFLTSHRVAGRLRWPWPVVMGRFGQPGGELEAMLKSEDTEDLRLAIDALASGAFLLTAGAGPRHELGKDARARLLSACAEAPASETPSLLAAAAAAALPESLAVIFPAAGGGGIGATIAGLADRAASVVALPGYGEIGIAPAAEALAAIGYLARLLPAADPVRAEAFQVLGLADAADVHPSVPVGRLIGRAFLGDWEPVLAALKTGPVDVRLPQVGRNAVCLWAKETPAAVIARWTAARLAEPGLTPEAMCVYAELKHVTEERAGALVPAETASDFRDPSDI